MKSLCYYCVWFIIAQNKTSQPNSKAIQNTSPKQNHKTKQTKISKQNSKVKTKPQNKTAKQKCKVKAKQNKTAKQNFKVKAKQNKTAWNTVLLFAVYWSTKKTKKKNSKLQNLKFHVICIVPLTHTCSFILGWLSLVLLFLCFCSRSLDLLLFQVMSCVMWTSTVVI